MLSLTFKTQIHGSRHSQSGWHDVRHAADPYPSRLCLFILSNKHLAALRIHDLNISSHHDIWTIITKLTLACLVVPGNRLHKRPEGLIGIV